MVLDSATRILSSAALFSRIGQAQQGFAATDFVTALRQDRLKITNGPERTAVTNFLFAGPEVVRRLDLSGTRALHVPSFLRLHPEMRSVADNDLIYVDIALRFMRGLTQDDLTGSNKTEISSVLQVVHYHLESITARIVARFLKEGKLSQLVLEDMLHPLIHGKRIEFVHINCNATHANKFDDQQGVVCDALLDKTEEWLNTHLRMPVFRTPGGTSFLVICTNLETVRFALPNLSRDVRRMMHADQDLHEHVLKATKGSANLFDFIPRHVAVGSHLQMTVPSLRGHRLEAFALAELLTTLQKAAAAASYLEDTRATGQFYLLDDVEPHLDAYLARRSGWVPYGVYGLETPNVSHTDLSSSETALLVQHPRARRIVGLVTRPITANHGGAIERFDLLLSELATLPDSEMPGWFARFTSLLGPDGTPVGLLGASRVFGAREDEPVLEHLTVLGNLAERVVAEPNTYRDLDTFLRDSTLDQSGSFVFYEYDDFGAYKGAYPDVGHDDAHFRSVGGTFDRLARDSGQKPKRQRYQGDFMIAAHASGYGLTEQFHGAVAKQFADKPFQRRHKVKVTRTDLETGREYADIERIPIWFTVTPGGERRYRAARERPGTEWEPLMGTMKISAVHAELAPITTRRQRADFRTLARRVGTYIDRTVKFATGEAWLEVEGSRKPVPFALHKGGLLRLPLDMIPMSLRPPATDEHRDVA